MQFILKLMLVLAGVTFNPNTQPTKLSPTNQSSQPIYEPRDGEVISTCGFDTEMNALMEKYPEMKAEQERYLREALPKILAQAKLQQRSTQAVLTVPIVFHVIHKGESVGQGQNLPVSILEAQLQTLNEDFSAQNPNFNDTPDQWKSVMGSADIRFCIATVDPDGMPTNGVTRHEYQNVTNANIKSTIKPQTIWDSKRYLNIWTLPIPGTTSNGGVTGWAFLPFFGSVGANYDGLVLDYRFTGAGQKTATHEIGHYLGLYHTWGTSNGATGCGNDDGLDDTPTCEGPAGWAYSCRNPPYPAGKQSCGNEQMYVNYMDYSPRSCKTGFTLEQIAVMRATLMGTNATPTPEAWASRASLLESATVVAPTCATNTGGGGGGILDPDPIVITNDAGISAISDPDGTYCPFAPIAPVVTIENQYGDDNLTSATIKYFMNNGPATTYQWTGNLAKGESEEVTLPASTMPGNAFVLKVVTSNPNGQADDLTLNDEFTKDIFITAVMDLPFEEDFESSKFEPTNNGLTSTNNPSDFVRWVRAKNISGFGTGSGSTVFNNRYQGATSPAGTSDTLFTPFLDFTTLANPRLKFDVAYAPYVELDKVDGLEVLISTSCGGDFTRIYYKEGLDLSTRFPLFNTFVPASDEWRQEKIELAQYSNETQVRIAFVNHSGGGNAIYLDNINLKVGCDGDVTATSQNLSCGGDCSGSIDLEVTGIDNYTVTWSDANLSGLSQTGLCAGMYSVTVTDGGFCTFVNEFELTQPLEIVVDLWTSNETAIGANDGTAILTNISGGNGTKTIQWSTGATTETITGLAPGDYDVTVTDGDCEIIKTFTISPFQCQFSATPNVVQPQCPGDGGAIGMNLSGGAGNYTFDWDPINPFGSVPIRNPAPPGNYSITVTDNLGCSAVVTALVEEASLDYNEIITDVTTYNGSDGAITLDVQGLLGTATYNWSNNQTSQSISGLSPGIYTVSITDDGRNCSQPFVKEFEIKNIECDLMFSANASDVTCAGADDGTAAVAIVGGRDPYTISWNNGMSGAVLTGLSAGDYTVTVTDDNGCEGIEQVTITEPTAINVNLSPTNVTVQNGSNGSIITTVSGGMPDYSYKWNYQGSTDKDLTNLIGGDYSLTVTDANGCTVVTTVTIEEPFCPDLNFSVLTTQTSCADATDGTATIQLPQGSGYFVQWDNNDVGGSADNLAPGVHSVTVTVSEENMDCVYEKSYTITAPDPISIDITKTNESIMNAADGSATATVTGGTGTYSYDWGAAGTTATISNLSAGTYTVTVSDESDCTATANVEILINDTSDPCANFEATIVPTIPCTYEKAILSLAPSGGTGPYTYLWSNGETASSITVLEEGVISGTITDGNSCTASSELNVEFPTPITGNVETTDESTIGAADGTATLTASGGVGTLTYTWSIPNETGTSVSGLTAGSYSVVIADENDCDIIVTFSINVEATSGCPSFKVVGESTNVLCNGDETGSIFLTPSGGDSPYTYIWNTEAESQNLENIGPGTYYVTITDANECVLVKNFMITEPDPIIIEATTVMNDCYGDAKGSIQLDVSGGVSGYTFAWTGSDSDGPDANNLQAGEYVVTVTDESGCEKVEDFVITEPTEIEIFVEKTNQSALGLNDGYIKVTPSGGTAPYSISWDNSVSGNENADLAPGVYTCTVTDANDCEKVLEVEILEADNLCQNFGVEIESTNVLCFGDTDGSATAMPVSGSSPYAYLWSNQETTQTVSNLTAGMYQVTVTDNNDCEAVGSIEIIAPSELSLELSSTRETIVGQADGTATATVTGGTSPYTYLWGNSDTQETATGLSAGSISVLVRDANGCEISGDINIGSGDPDCSSLASDFETTPISCKDSQDGGIKLLPTGGEAPYNYRWGGGQNTQELSGISGGAYVATVSDANECEVIVNINLVEPELLTVEIDGQNGFCGQKGYATAVVSGGTGPYTYAWNTSASNKTITNLVSGDYSVEVTDAHGCSANGDISLNVEVYEEGINYVVEAVSCYGSQDGRIEVSTSGGHQPYTYSWSNGATTPVVENLAADVYTVFITDNNGCVNSQTYEVTSPPALEVVILTDHKDNGLVTVTAGASGGTAPYTYLWDNGLSDVSLNNVAEGSYFVTVTDAHGCEEVASVVTTDNNDVNSILGMSLTPNPTADVFVLEIDLASSFDLKIGVYDLLGQKIIQKNTTGLHIKKFIDVSKLSPGTYYVNITAGNSSRTEKLVVIR